MRDEIRRQAETRALGENDRKLQHTSEIAVENTKLNLKLDEMKHKLSEMHAEIDRRNRDSDAANSTAINDLQVRYQRLSTSNNELNIAINELRSSRANALKEKDKLQKVNETQTKIIEHLEREKMTMNLTVESNNSSMINASNDLKATQAKLLLERNTLQKLNEAQATMIEQLEAEKVSLQKTKQNLMQENELKNHQHTTLTKNVEGLNQQLVELQQHVAKAEAETRAHHLLSDKYNELLEENHRLRAEEQKISQSLHEKSEALILLKSKFDSLCDSSKVFEVQIENLKTQKLRVEQENSSLRNKMSSMEVKNCAEIDSAKAQAESIKEENQSLRLSNDVLLERITLLEKNEPRIDKFTEDDCTVGKK